MALEIHLVEVWELDNYDTEDGRWVPMTVTEDPEKALLCLMDEAPRCPSVAWEVWCEGEVIRQATFGWSSTYKYNVPLRRKQGSLFVKKAVEVVSPGAL